MMKMPAKSCLAVLILVTAASHAAAQHWYDYAPPPADDCSWFDFDWELFEPVDCFWDGHPPKPGNGYFFDYGRAAGWIMRPGRAPIGSTGPVVPAVFSPNGVDYVYVDDGSGNDTAVSGVRDVFTGGGFFINQYNGIDDAYAAHAQGWGNHFKLGWMTGRTGWMLTVTEGLRFNRTDLYGFDDKTLNQFGAAQGLDGIDGIPDLDGSTGAGTATNPVAPVPGIQAILYINGLLTVPVNFDDPFGLLLGFVDFDGDEVADDVNGDGIVDLNDRVRMAVVFDDMAVRNSTNLNSVELAAIRRKKPLPGGAVAEFFLGARYFELDDRFAVDARGGTLGDSNWDNRALNRIIGPSFGMRIAKQSRRFSSVFQARFLAGANFMSTRLDGVIADHLITGGQSTLTVNGVQNVPNGLGGNSFFHRRSNEYFSPVGELQYELGFLLTRHVNLKAAWTGTVVGGVSRASNTVAYTLPNLAILNKQEDVFTHMITFGVEVNR